ncbi:LysM peptidoglycan-binding domain-containing protein [Natranaerofaba carboxydovora]|uniref:LysM peptidoglycan-binding domain-containing protein n=1 Tax=Natranaerofaba carboxydovora TaxID=2742683 RepID=UPI001F13B733|nr:LysM peptidoglycan-binding domain-containing protein [Natranaerofaba carboxydovora]UMZ73539.1 LysM domain protein [Natranaerofaba carboxydovora]
MDKLNLSKGVKGKRVLKRKNNKVGKKIKVNKNKVNKLLGIFVILTVISLTVLAAKHSTGIALAFFEKEDQNEEIKEVASTDKSAGFDLEPDESEANETTIVQDGDTLWNIAKEYNENDTDLRKFVYKIRELNNLDDAMLYPGKELKIPK